MLEVEGGGVPGDRLCPEQTGSVANARVEIVDLAGASGTGEEVHSDEGKRPVMSFAIFADVQAVHEPVVHLVEVTGRRVRQQVGACAAACDPTHSDHAV